MAVRYTPILLPVSHVQQRRDGECLPACAAMVLTYLGRPVNYNQLVKLLGTQSHGTPFFNICYLEKLGVAVDAVKGGTLDQLYNHLSQNRPCITSVLTGDLPHWETSILHAVVIVGLDDTHIYLNDPDAGIAPIRCPIGDFDLAWLSQDELYATIMHRHG
jgi:ABC-type bacteriocin/lantibiotic exporter with double-glycine peptidase domain